MGSANRPIQDVLRLAGRACSGHNTQPWAVRMNDGGCSVIADHSRRLPVVDPDNREMFISIGAYTEALTLAGGACGYHFETRITAQTPYDAEAVRINISPAAPRNTSVKDLISQRRTVRNGMQCKELKAIDVAFLTAGFDRITYLPLGSDKANKLKDMALEYFVEQTYNDIAQKEISRWTRLSSGEIRTHRDGLTLAAMDVGPLTSLLMGFFMDRRAVMSDIYRKKSIELTGRQVNEGGGWLVISTKGDRCEDWISAGRQFYRMAIISSAENIGFHPMSQMLENKNGRKEVRSLIGDGYPQMTVRVGYVGNYGMPSSPRRDISDYVLSH